MATADVVLDPLRRELTEHCLRMPELRASTPGDESVTLGAVRPALDEVDSRLLSDWLAAPAAPRPVAARTGYAAAVRTHHLNRNEGTAQ
ncbi:hypothetical protein ABZ687_19550 [Streptomyces ardesiacus]|uniref:hypothetical protein n=1 Tax=Streptomyces TaxID=1883 RepID=UPI0006AD93B7|nr:MULTISPECIES: hypothetical protein [Streptomyces]KOX32664.1 hypothetical protein ADL07_10660 [Streptomyces sp. NRRL F-4707]MCL7364011.1 hypothetical protein [Streptomyces ardesiacus]